MLTYGHSVRIVEILDKERAMNTKHTPGPRRHKVDDYSTRNLVYAGAELVAATHGPHDKEANARLIAAAPDMLEACCSFVAWLESDEAGPDYGTLTRDTHPEGERIWREWWHLQQDLCRRAQDEARAAIAKARGES
jgi:hypothetical protein